ncbi:hypothetical protein ELY33_17240 [Vreelandella andesensis]|uniref:Uncharacterized protein n=1 Tax=Vreelandella andesensis TaxID=447567 RepID=A0A433KF28_9GAMM|nr:hypothetical protein [Halomonas andesensis]RUR26853.1 hypothetical protein ELY33_17240 [Halomonas andesensis]
MSEFRKFVGLRISTQAGAVPTTAQLGEGELAFNIADRKIFARFGSNIDDITDRYSQQEIDGALSGKVDAVEGKGLSDRNYTQGEKTKLAAVGTLANRNVYLSDQPHDDAVGQDGDLWLQYWDI